MAGADGLDVVELRHRLLGVLWERLAELEADSAREAISQRKKRFSRSNQ